MGQPRVGAASARDVKIIDVGGAARLGSARRESRGAAWGANSADMAFILYQKPVLVAVHGRDMLENLRLSDAHDG